MKIVFFGTPEYTVPVLSMLHKKYVTGPGISPIAAVVTQKPAPTGRAKKLSYTPVDKWAFTHKITICYGSADLLANKGKIEADIGILAAYGEILPKEVVNMFPHGILNIHTSLLPKYRGASPEQAAILMGDEETGGTIMRLDEKMDHGSIVTQFKVSVAADDNRESLRNKIFEAGVLALDEVLEPYFRGKVKPKAQDHDKATYTHLLKKEHGFLPPKAVSLAMSGNEFEEKFNVSFIKNCEITLNPITIERYIRALSPWPGAWTIVKTQKEPSAKSEKRIRILKAHIEKSPRLKKDILVLDQVQLESKNPVSFDEFLRGYPSAALV